MIMADLHRQWRQFKYIDNETHAYTNVLPGLCVCVFLVEF